ncbi:Seed biotin-containing protein SBP65 [Apostasia shenzhenica]|uniref:Seed biotin-containing protein SBP65 n=1 Tax=Apostasia shenzhenica TaxID=1088818 RepID=A0A2I0BGZ1_9ASPA|nr:Seed biotin-containing protein SBP65 [Apostasia shenzhenica]
MASIEEIRKSESKDEQQQQKLEQEQRQQKGSPAISPEEIHQYRSTAQQNSIEAIRAAEERYAKAKESGSTALQSSKEAVTHGLGAATAYLSEKGSQAARSAADYMEEKGRKGYEAVNETAVSAAQNAAELAQQSTVKTKNAALSTGEAAANYSIQAAGKTKEASLAAGGTTADCTKTAVQKAKDVTFELWVDANTRD